jgi:hypothetical protein
VGEPAPAKTVISAPSIMNGPNGIAGLAFATARSGQRDVDDRTKQEGPEGGEDQLPGGRLDQGDQAHVRDVRHNGLRCSRCDPILF